MIELTKQEMTSIIPLIKECRDRNVELQALVEGKMEGVAWVDNKENPSTAIVSIADFCFLLGINEKKEEESYIKHILEQYKGKLIVNYDKYWDIFIEKHFATNHKKSIRYAIKKETDVFDGEKLKGFIKNIEQEFQIEKIDATNYNKVLEDDFMADCCSNFSSLDDFEDNGIGYIIIHEDEIISGASSYSYCNGIIDITIGTKRKYRKRGLALACASKVILECLDKNIYPNWDASNLESVALAEKLGYHFDEEYYVNSIS
ncbi:GNAT family N-acetyltransferase [Clostridium sp. UBA6640]|uniref:GNAT family N-acetyltransferase n=1 Tax=Clostridium sp. UBA6640 TaxID=1946370 RepID=UPI0025BD3BE5|nr:GNAT family N-acetyltransferase [Clostridium sp. UBA6640]